MTNLAHWQDDIDEALGGDFDGSLSGLCIMSLSFDFTRNGSGPHLANNSATISSATHQATGGLLSSSSNNRPNSSTTGITHETHSDNSNNCFKRFKPCITSDTNHEDENRINNQSKIARQLQQLKNCLNTTSLNNTLITTNLSNVPTGIQGQPENQNESDDRSSPQSSCHRASAALSTTNESSRSSTVGARSPSPQSCSSISTHSRTSSRSQSPSDMSIHSCHNNTGNNNETRSTPNNAQIIQHRGKNVSMHNEPSRQSVNDNQQLSLYSIKDNLLSGSTLKESSYTTSVITTTAPMHFKSLHHPFALKQFPLSPYHQFSNSSLNHDFYDRYLSHDSHQPLQTPLIGIERTQDLLSLKLPPHGPEDLDSQKFPKEWSFDDASKLDNNPNRVNGNAEKRRESNQDCSSSNNQQAGVKRKEAGSDGNSEKGFPFNYKSNSNTKSNDDANDQREPIDLNVSYEQDDCCNNDSKKDIFTESMNHFNPDRVQQNACFNLRQKNNSPSHNDSQVNETENATNIAHQYLGQESMFGIDPSKQKFKYVLAAPISVATKLSEDTMTYLNQGQAYEIKLENTTDVAEARKGFMCSIINIGFYERHMQQAENELWQQWSQQHPNEKIFSVDMKLSYNVFGVESDGLNKYEFLWDSSKAAGVFIRINSISTEFTPKKHGGEKGVPFKLSIETFSYNSKTHDSYFISAACCQIKVFKPKGAERKIRSDRDKVSKRPPIEQEKYHRCCDHTSFKECSITSLHPMADGSLCYYRHSHGHFASKQIAPTNASSTISIQNQQAANQQVEEDIEQVNNASQQNLSPENHSTTMNKASQLSNDSETSSNGQSGSHQRNYQNNDSRQLPIASKLHQSDYSNSRLIQPHNQFVRNNLDNHVDPSTDHSYGHQQAQVPVSESNHSCDLLQLQQPNSFNQMYHTNSRGVASLASINNTQHFGMSYYGHTLTNSIQSSHIPSTSSYVGPTSTTFSATHPSHNGHTFSTPAQHHIGTKISAGIQRNLSTDKQSDTIPTSQSTSFKASNLALTSHNNNFQSYLSNHTDQCVETSPHDMKDGSMSGSYHHDIYDSHLHHNLHSTNLHSHQPFRHRSASMITSNNHCSAYNTNQGRHFDNYSGNNGVPIENTSNANHWIHSSTNHSQLSSSSPLYNNQRVNANSINHSHDSHAYNNVTHNFDCNQQYSLDQNSPLKNHHTSDSSSSCNSRFRNNSSIVPTVTQQVHYDENRSYCHIGQITMNSNCNEVVSWFAANRFGVFSKTFNNFSGSDLLRLSKNDLIEICGLIDGIRLFNSLHNQPIKPRRVLYVCHQSGEIFHPIYLYDLSLKELLKELSIVFNSYLSECDNRNLEDKQQKTIRDKTASNSSSSTDSRSSMGALSTENGTDEVYNQNEHFFNNIDSQRQRKGQVATESSSTIHNVRAIDRLLVDGITSVKIVATEQVVQILENESVWTFSATTGNSRFVEACITACKRNLNK